MLNKKFIFVFLLILSLFGFYFFVSRYRNNVNKSSVNIYTLTSVTIPDSINVLFRDGYKLGQVGLEVADLEKEFKLMFEYNQENTQNLYHWIKATQSLNDKAIIQNEGISVGLFTETNFNPKRVNEAKEYIEKQGKTHISGEFISIWFLNVNPPNIGVEKAKDIAFSKISTLRDRVTSKEITMIQAGEEIRNDISLAGIDNAYESNAYRRFNSIGRDQQIFTDLAIDKKLWDTEVGEVSDILVAKDYNENGPYDAYFIVIKVDEKEISEYVSLEDLLKIRKQQGLEINLDNIK